MTLKAVYYSILKKDKTMRLDLEKLIKYLEKLDRDIIRLQAQRDSFKQLLKDATEVSNV